MANSAGTGQPRIHLAFRFHINFYHSYRGDTVDERGFGKDIRIIRRIVRVLDDWNARGVPVRGTWDTENYFSLERIMPQHCPDLIESLQRRVAAGQDEMELMSYNNGLVTAHTPVELDATMSLAIRNDAGSGLGDLFASYAPIVRPQEMMYTPHHLALYARHGIECISLFYSGVPFNAFSNFLPPLPLEQRCNPLRLTYPGLDASLLLLPAHNHGDVAEHVSFKRWLKQLRRYQLSMAQPIDFLLLIDADADDDFWAGYKVRWVDRVLPELRGLDGLIDIASKLEFVTFTTPGEYLKSHQPLATICIAQDTADGSFDGYSSWAEKWSNHRLWTGIERSRILELQTRRLLDDPAFQGDRSTIAEHLKDAARARLLSLSTTHFGLASPVVNRTRMNTVTALVNDAMQHASQAFDLARGARPATAGGDLSFQLVDYVRGLSTDAVAFTAAPSRCLIRMPLRLDSDVPGNALLCSESRPQSAALRRLPQKDDSADTELIFVARFEGGDRRHYRLDIGVEQDEASRGIVVAREGVLLNECVTLSFDALRRPMSLVLDGTQWAEGELVRSAVNYRGKVTAVERWHAGECFVLGGGSIGLVTVNGSLALGDDAGSQVRVEREYLLAAGLPYLFVDTRITYPKTHSANYKRERARRLEEIYDGHWREVMPCELRPALLGRPGKPLRVWKHGYSGHVSVYEPDYAAFSANRELDSFNNHVTHGWVAVSDGERGLLVAQSADVTACFAFCPMRTRRSGDDTRIFLNPFGSYYGRQLTYATGVTGLGKFLAMRFADTCDPHAPSYNGKVQHLRLLIAPYLGDAPPVELQRDALAFAYPHAVLSDDPRVATPAHRRWTYEPVSDAGGKT
jgi:hypothetical protein